MTKAKKYENKYWENEKAETVEFGNGYFIRCYDQAGKLQFGKKFKDKQTGEDIYHVKFVIDRKELFSSDEAPSYLRQLISDWEEMMEEAAENGELS